MKREAANTDMGKKMKKLAGEAALFKKLKQMWQRGQSELCEVRGSRIHGRGVYATRDIPAGTKIIEYVGELIDKRAPRLGPAREVPRNRRCGGLYLHPYQQAGY